MATMPTTRTTLICIFNLTLLLLGVGNVAAVYLLIFCSLKDFYRKIPIRKQTTIIQTHKFTYIQHTPSNIIKFLLH